MHSRNWVFSALQLDGHTVWRSVMSKRKALHRLTLFICTTLTECFCNSKQKQNQTLLSYWFLLLQISPQKKVLTDLFKICPQNMLETVHTNS